MARRSPDGPRRAADGAQAADDAKFVPGEVLVGFAQAGYSAQISSLSGLDAWRETGIHVYTSHPAPFQGELPWLQGVRSEVVHDGQIDAYHVWAMCVRRAYLCRVDRLTDNDYNDRRRCIEGFE